MLPKQKFRQVKLFVVLSSLALLPLLGTSFSASAASDPTRLFGWGDSYAAGLGGVESSGDDDPIPAHLPVEVDLSTGLLAGKTITSMSSGDQFTCAVADGKAYCWGREDVGSLGDGNETDSAFPVAVSTSGVLSGKTVTKIAAGDDTVCVIADGKAYCWGNGEYGRLGNGSELGFSSVPVEVDTSGVLSGKTITDIAVGDEHTCAIAGGKAYCWGGNNLGQIGDNSQANRLTPVAVDDSGALSGKTVTDISVGDEFTCAVASGKAYCWGEGDVGKLGNDAVEDKSTPVAVSTAGVLAGKTVTAIANGDDHACAIAGGKVYCWGENESGQLGGHDGDYKTSPFAVKTDGVLSGKKITAIDSNTLGETTCALSSDGKLFCWGEDDLGSLGDGEIEITAAKTGLEGPVAVDFSGIEGEVKLTGFSVGDEHVQAITGGLIEEESQSESEGEALPDTGSPVSLWLIAASLASIAIGVGAWRRQTS